MIKTDHITEFKTSNTAAEFDDYCPILQKITFAHYQTEVRVPIQLVNKDLPELGDKLIDQTNQNNEEKQDEEEESSDEETDLMF